MAALNHIDSVLAKKSARAHPGNERIRTLLDSFTIARKDHKANLCLVFKPLGVSLSEYANLCVDEGGLPINVIKEITFQLLVALDFFHGQVSLVHTDVQEGNVMFSIESESELRKVEEEELSDPSARKVYKDGHIIFETRPVDVDVEWPILCDFGEARFGQDEYDGQVLPDLYRAPEILLGRPWTNKVDIWAMGLMVRPLLSATISNMHIIVINTDFLE